MKKELKSFFVIVLTIACFIVIGFIRETGPKNIMATAEETVEVEEVVESGGSDENSEEVNDLVSAFIQYLKDEYGEEYEKYYTAIIDQWGSVKNYLDGKIQDGTLTDETAGAWSALLCWLDEYSVIWAPTLAIIALIAVMVAGRKIYISVKKLFNRLFKGSNQTASAQIAVIEALEKLLGNTEKTATEREKLEKAKEELLKNE